MERNESPKAIFHTDEERTYFYTEIQINRGFIEPAIGDYKVHEGVHEGVHEASTLSETDQKLLKLLSIQPLGMSLILEGLGYSGDSRNRNVRASITKLLDNNLIAYTIPDKPRSKNQQYKITQSGLNYLSKLKGKTS